jgi:hypothetical protein
VRIQDLKLEGSHLKKLRRAEGGANIFGVFRVKNHDFTPTIVMVVTPQTSGSIMYPLGVRLSRRTLDSLPPLLNAITWICARFLIFQCRATIYCLFS